MGETAIPVFLIKLKVSGYCGWVFPTQANENPKIC
uniref:Uncharacterized protein n=1 Tax=Human betaherpesvirus 6 TaxID=10368 RepID=A0A5P9S8E4_9BETA|nr:hypothetical protein [Human betaherpesvirus 6]